MNATKPSALARSLRRTQWVGFIVLGLLAIGLGGWAAATEIAGAIIASGQVSVRSNAKKIQHLEGGIVRELKVRNGDRVAAGDLVARLDDTEARAMLEIIDAEYLELLVRQARLEAERDKTLEMRLPVELDAFTANSALANTIDGEIKLLASRLDSLHGKQRQLREQVTQNDNQITGLQAQFSARAKEAKIAANELEALKGLAAKGLIQKHRVLALEREVAQLAGERGQLTAEIARLKGTTSEIELRVIQIEDDWRAQVLADLSEVRTEVASLRQRRQAAKARLERVEIFAPLDGFVHDLSVHAVGSVVGPGEPIMLIVPEGEPLVIRTKVRPQDIDAVSVGQDARIRLTAFNQRTTPELHGEVLTVGADLSFDPEARVGFFLVDVSIPSFDPDMLGGEPLRPGMPAEVFIQTGKRTALSYLLKPLTEQIERTFRE